MGRVIDSEYFRKFYDDSGWWEYHYMEDSEFVFYDDSGDWVLDGEVDLAECGDVYGNDLDATCSMLEFFTKWELHSGASEFCLLQVKVYKKDKESLVENLNDLAIDLGFEIEVL